MTAQAAPAPDVVARLDALPVTQLHIVVVVLCALGFLFDVAEAALSNALSAVFTAPPHAVAPDRLALLLGSVFAGGAIRAPLLGWLADRKGRRLSLIVSLLLLAVTSTLAAMSPNITWLTAFRVLSGLALGAYPPLMVAYLSDVLPPGRRGMLILVCGAIGFLGAPAVVFLIRWLTPRMPFGLDGWRWALVIGAVGSLVIGLMLRMLPESPRWLTAVGRQADADAVCRRFERSAGLKPACSVSPVGAGGDGLVRQTHESFWSAAGGRHRLRAILLGVLYFLSPWATIGFPLLSGAVLIEKGFRVSDSLLYLGITLAGPTLGVLAGATVIDRLERQSALALTGSLMAVLGLAFSVSATPGPLMAAGIAFNLIGAIYVATLSIYGAELFPTALRAAASSSAWAVNRVTSALVPVALLPLLKGVGAVAMFSVIAAALMASVLLILAVGPKGLARQPVE
jgi:putative MFS transporter